MPVSRLRRFPHGFLALLFHLPLTLAVLRTYNFTVHSETRAPDGFSRVVYLINGQQPGPLIDVDEGDELEVFVKNDLAVATTIHWHGLFQRGSPHMDGVPGVTQYAIPAGGNFTYRIALGDQYGFFWYHSHVRAYYNDGIRGPLLIRPSASRARPFEQLATNEAERRLLLEAERDATSILLNDWTHELSDVVWERYFRTGAFPNCVDSLLANGMGRVQCLPDDVLQAGPGMGENGPGMDQPSTAPGGSMSTPMGTHTTTAATSATMMGPSPAVTSLSPRGCSMPIMFNPGYDASSLPAETCTNTTSALLQVSANSARGWLALNLVNAGAVSALRVSVDGHSMFVYAADGLYVQMQEVEVLHMAVGQRYSVMIRLNQDPANYLLRFATYPLGDMQQVLQSQAIVSYDMDNSNDSPMATVDNPAMAWMMVNGSTKGSARLLDPQRVHPFEPTSFPRGAAKQTHVFKINQTDVTTWVVDRAPFQEPKVPIIYGAQSDGWRAITTLHMPSNSVIDIIMVVAHDSMDTMGHPMHLHGHKFWVLGTGSGDFPHETAHAAPASLLDFENPPYRDTVELPASGWAVIRYVTDNPGAWMLHCHIQWHMVSGMAVVLVEGEDKLAELVGSNPSSGKATDGA